MKQSLAAREESFRISSARLEITDIIHPRKDNSQLVSEPEKGLSGNVVEGTQPLPRRLFQSSTQELHAGPSNALEPSEYMKENPGLNTGWVGRQYILVVINPCFVVKMGFNRDLVGI